jgi:uncharacterized lipoprotein YddW (UPF0748 family)
MFSIHKLIALLVVFVTFGGAIVAQDEEKSPSNFINLYGSRQSKHETRAVWLTTIKGLDWPKVRANDINGIERQKKDLCEILDRLQRIHINTVILQTRIRGTVIYPSEYEPWDECLTGRPGKDPGYDPLQYCIEECHKRGMELHAWLVCVPLGNDALQKRYGSESILQRNPTLCKKIGSEVFMIPGKPETASYIASLCKEIVSQYDVDGISLDYIRYPEKVYGFSDDEYYPLPSSSSQPEETKAVKARGRKSARAKKPAIPAAELAAWRRDNITRIVRAVHDSVKPLKPWMKLSSSPIGKYKDLGRYSAYGWSCYDAVWQDPQAWLRDNLQDLLFPMMYFQGNHFYPFLFDWLENSYGHPVVPGLGIYFLDPREGKWTLNQIRAEIHTSRASGIGGVAFYRSDFLTRNLQNLYDACAEEFFPYPALTARMTWMPTDTTKIPSPPTQLEMDKGCLQWQGDAYYYNVYGSNQWPVDCSKAENLLAPHVQGTAYALRERDQYLRYFAVTASDRFGNESATAAVQNEKRKVVKPYRRIITKP